MNAEQKRDEYKKYDMIYLPDPGTAAYTCAGCHVGAPAVKDKDGKVIIPTRDMSHELLGAGHPRLNFEFSSYLANMPRHWNEERKRKGLEATFEARLWAAGQVASAQAALEILAEHARNPKPWPEFSDYDCYACHHDLREPAWRQKRGYAGRVPGSLPFNDWYFVMLPYVPGGSPPPAIGELRQALQKPVPDPKEVFIKASDAARQLASWRAGLGGESGKISQSDVRSRVTQLGERGPQLAQENWDHVDQAIQALFALYVAYQQGMGQQPSKSDQTWAAIQKLAEMLAFPRGYDSPQSFRLDPKYGPELDALFKQIR
jgi:hypothetical protein